MPRKIRRLNQDCRCEILNRCVFIIPYFGKFNNYFQLFLDSCEKNPYFDWLIFTDDKRAFNYPSNVHVHYTTFELLQKKIKAMFSFSIILEKPYKLCDYRMAYGHIFYEYVGSYEFWGYCDVDLIFGEISRFITDDILDKYDRILERGHLTLFRNCEDINNLYKSSHHALFIDYHYAFTTKYACHFDEFEPWKKVLQDMQFRQWSLPIFADISCNSYRFILEYGINRKNKQIYMWNDGVLRRYYLENDIVCQDEWCYIHLQKRKMYIKRQFNQSKYWIVPNKIFFVDKMRYSIEYLINVYGDEKFYLARTIGRVKEIGKNILNGAVLFRIKRILRNMK